MVTSPPTLEELFLRHYGEDISAQREGAAAEAVTAR
jgi:ABC-2 type transport system ATP-binding protein